jgi:effector-binding domain-containing protein
MLDAPQVIQLASRPCASIHLLIPRDQIQAVMGPGLAELKATLAEQGIEATGPWFTHHLRMVPDAWDFEICLPVASPVAASGRVRPGEWPAMRVARTVYSGPFEGLGPAWGEFLGWIAGQGHAVGPDLYECYLSGPESGSDPAGWRTELTKPLLG